MVVPSKGQGVQEHTSKFWKQAIRMGIFLEELRVLVKYLGGLFSHIRRQVPHLSMKSIDGGQEGCLY